MAEKLPEKFPDKRWLPLWWFLKGLSLLPFPALYLLSDLLYFVVYKVFGYRKKVVWQNLKNAFPEKIDSELLWIMAAFYHNLCDIIVETVKLASLSREELDRRITIKNPEVMMAQLQAGKRIITLGSHLANWEWALAAAYIKFGFVQEGVYKPLSNPFFEWYVVTLRTRLGGNLIKMKDTLRHLLRNRNTAGVLHLLADQTPPGGEIQYWTDFLHQDTPFYVGGEKLATSFNLPVVFFGCKRTRRGFYEYELELLHDGKTALPTREYPITELYVRQLEKWIQTYPADYLWSHKRWKHKRQPAPEIQENPVQI